MAQLPSETSRPDGEQKSWMVPGSNNVKIQNSCDASRGGHYYIKSVEKILKHVTLAKSGGAHPAQGEPITVQRWV